MKHVFLFVFLASLFLWNPCEAQSKKVTLKIATSAPKGSIWMKELEKMGKQIKRKTRGKVVLTIQSGAIAGEEPTIARKVQSGALDGAAFAGTGLGMLSTHVRVLELPFMYKSTEEWQYVLDNLSEKLEKSYHDKGYKIMGWTAVGFAFIFSKEPLTTLKDIRQSKVWFYEGSDMLEDCFRKLSVSGVPSGLADVITSLETGRINCVYCPPYFALISRWHESVNYCTRLYMSNVTGALVMSNQGFRKVPKKYRKTVAKICRKAMDNVRNKVEAENKKAEKILTEKFNVKFLEPKLQFVEPGDEVKDLETFSTNLANDQIGKLYPQELLDETRQLLKKYRSENK